MQTVANRNVRDFGWEMSSRGGLATPADLPRHDCSPYRALHVRRESAGFVDRFKGRFLSPRAKPDCVPIPRRFRRCGVLTG